MPYGDPPKTTQNRPKSLPRGKLFPLKPDLAVNGKRSIEFATLFATQKAPKIICSRSWLLSGRSWPLLSCSRLLLGRSWPLLGRS